MTRTLTITFEKSNEDIPVMCVAESNLFSVTVVKMFTGEKAEQEILCRLNMYMKRSE